jgi:HEAT repeat protein
MPSRSARIFLLSLSLLGLLPLVGGCQDFRSFWGRRSVEEDLKAIEDPVFPDERRIGVAGLQRREEQRDDPAVRARFRELGEKDPHSSVRAQAVRALNQGRDDQARPLYLALLDDPEPRVRLEAVKALRNIPDERAVPRLTALATNDEQDRDVRIYATSALRNYPRIDVARTLVTLVDARDFAVSYEARASLKRLTKKDFHYDPALWLAYLTGRPDPFAIEMPTTRAGG